MKIAVCDDEENDLIRISRYIIEYNKTINVNLFSSGQALLEAFKTNPFDIVFLDIEMPAPNGYEVAKSLHIKEEKPLVIFVTKSSKYAVQGYEVAFRYLVKPFNQVKFNQILEKALKIATPKKISINSNGQTYILSTNKILYFEVFDHNLSTHTTEGNFICRMALREVMNLLEGKSFSSPHKSYFINLCFVQYLTNNHVILTNGEKIQISRNKKKEFRDSLNKYLKRL